MVLVLLAQARGERIHLLLRLLQRDAILQAGHYGEHRGITGVLHHVARDDPPRIHSRGHAGVFRHVNPEVRRQNPYDEALLTVHLDALAEHGRIAAESSLPQSIAEHDDPRQDLRIRIHEDLRIHGHGVFDVEVTAEHRAHTEDLEEVGRDPTAHHLFRGALARE